MLGEIVDASYHTLAIVHSLVDHLYILLVDPCLRSWLHKRLSRRGPIFYGQARQTFHRFVWFLHHFDKSHVFEMSFIDFLRYRLVTCGQVKGRWCNSLAAGGCESAWQRHDHDDISFFLELHFLCFKVSNKNMRRGTAGTIRYQLGSGRHLTLLCSMADRLETYMSMFVVRPFFYNPSFWCWMSLQTTWI